MVNKLLSEVGAKQFQLLLQVFLFLRKSVKDWPHTAFNRQY